MTRLFIIRHGQTHLNAEGRLQGSTDAELNATGREQAQRAAQLLRGIVARGAVVVSSPLRRAKVTGQAVADAVGAELALDARLVERDYGVWEGVREADLIANEPELYEVWRSGGVPAVEGYEPAESVAARMRAALDEWVARTDGDLVFATHGTSARLLMLDLLGLSLKNHAIDSLENAAWSRMVPGEDAPWTLDRHNIGADG